MNSFYVALFDIDGTLLRGAGPQHKEALIAGIRKVMRTECTLDGVDTSGQLDRDLLRAMLKKAGVTPIQISKHSRAVQQASQRHYLLNCKADLKPCVCPGVWETLEMLKTAGIPMCLVTGNLSAIAWRKLELAGIDHYFAFGAFAEERITRMQLAALAVRKAQRKSLAHAKATVTLIGDHASDVGAAKGNGFRAVAVATGVMTTEELAKLGPDVTLGTLENVTVGTLFGT